MNYTNQNKTSLFIIGAFVWSFILGRLFAFGFRAKGILWYHVFKYESWYNLTQFVYKPSQLWYYIFQIILLLYMIGESNVWILLTIINLSFSYWHPVFMEDLSSWNRLAVMGFAIIVMLVFCLVWEHHDGERAVAALLILNFLYIYFPLVHATLVIKTPTRVSEYVERTKREVSDV